MVAERILFDLLLFKDFFLSLCQNSEYSQYSVPETNFIKLVNVA